MKTFIAPWILLGMSLASTMADGGDLQVIVLKDHSILRAQVLETSGGYYIIKSQALGETRIRTSDVISITSANQARPNPSSSVASVTDNNQSATTLPATPPSADAPPVTTTAGQSSFLQSALAAKVQSFISTQGGMSMVSQYAQNPDLQSVLSDPNLMKAIQSGDMATLLNSPAIKKLMENPQTKNLIMNIMGSTGK